MLSASRQALWRVTAARGGGTAAPALAPSGTEAQPAIAKTDASPGKNPRKNCRNFTGFAEGTRLGICE
jgi:hypothetical protein